MLVKLAVQIKCGKAALYAMQFNFGSNFLKMSKTAGSFKSWLKRIWFISSLYVFSNLSFSNLCVFALMCKPFVYIYCILSYYYYFTHYLISSILCLCIFMLVLTLFSALFLSINAFTYSIIYCTWFCLCKAGLYEIRYIIKQSAKHHMQFWIWS